MLAPGEKRRYRVRHLRADGSYVWIDVTNHNRLDDPEHGDVLAEMVDVSDEMAVHEALREREQLLRELADALPVGVLQFDADGATVHENEQCEAIVGASGLDGLSSVLRRRRSGPASTTPSAPSSPATTPEPLEVAPRRRPGVPRHAAAAARAAAASPASTTSPRPPSCAASSRCGPPSTP